MPLIDLTNTQENSGYKQLEAGAYVVRILSAEPVYGKEYLLIKWDVAEGPNAGFFARSQWPPKEYMSWKESALGLLKHRLHVLADANPRLTVIKDHKGEFAGIEEFQKDNWGAFVGCIFGANVRKRIYEKDDGSIGEGVEIGAWLSLDEVRAGNVKPLAPRDTTSRAGQTTRPSQPPQAPVQAPTPQVNVAYANTVDTPF